MTEWKKYDCVHWPEKSEGKCPYEENPKNCNNCQDYHPKRKPDYSELPLELFEKIAPYDLEGMVLNDCTYLSPKSTLASVEIWWKINGAFIMEAVLEKIQSSDETQDTAPSAKEVNT